MRKTKIIIRESPSKAHKDQVLWAAQLKLSQLKLKQKEPEHSLFDFLFEKIRHLSMPLAALTAAIFVLFMVTPRFKMDTTPVELPVAEMSLMTLDPDEWDDLEVVMDLEELEDLEEVGEWPEG